MQINLIAAMGHGRQIGQKGRLPWHVKEDFKHFKKTTWGHALIMGRKTYESLTSPLPGRTCIVLTRNGEYCPHPQPHHPHTLLAKSPEEALHLAQAQGKGEVFICGGEQIYKIFLPRAKKMYLSRIDFDGEADAFFPPWKADQWELFQTHSFPSTSHSPAWSLEILYRKA